jgi:uroporphyrinogen decarboxylase
MQAMTHRERVLAALNHQPTDRVPIDFGSSIVTTVYYTAYDRLKDLLGLEHETVMLAKTKRLAVPDESMLQHFDVDTRYLPLGKYEGNQSEPDERTYIDEWGTTWKQADDGHFLFVDGPLFNIKKPQLADLDRVTWPDPDNPGYYRGLAERAAAIRNTTDCAIVLNMPNGLVHQCQFLRGFGDWLKDLYKNKEFVSELMDRVSTQWIKVAENALEVVGDNVDILFFGDDLATQQAPLFSPDVYRELVKPRHKKMISAVKAKADVKVLYHCCGSVEPFINDIIDNGVDALNPVQISAANMDPATLKKNYGDRISFWGGISTQQVLPYGTPDEVRAEVRHMIDCLGGQGGYVLNSVHNIQGDVPAENIEAMLDEARNYHPDWMSAA